MNRRRFIVHTAALSGLSWTGVSVQAGARDWAKLDLVVFDERFASARQFAANIAQHGAVLRSIDGEITKLWYEHLTHLWSHDHSKITGKSAGQVAGMTLESAAVQLGWLARDRGYELTSVTTPYADGSGFGQTVTTDRISEAGLPVNLVSWKISQSLDAAPRWS